MPEHWWVNSSTLVSDLFRFFAHQVFTLGWPFHYIRCYSCNLSWWRREVKFLKWHCKTKRRDETNKQTNMQTRWSIKVKFGNHLFQNTLKRIFTLIEYTTILINLEVTTMKISIPCFLKLVDMFLLKIEILLLIRYSVTTPTEQNGDEI